MKKFNVGDKITYTGWGNGHVYPGYNGTIVDIPNNCLIGVEWNKQIKNGHHCETNCKNGHGWYVNIEMIEYAQSKKPFIISKINILSTLKKLEQYYK